MLVRGEASHVQEVREEITAVLAPLGLRLSQDKTRVVRMSRGSWNFGGGPVIIRRLGRIHYGRRHQQVE